MITDQAHQQGVALIDQVRVRVRVGHRNHLIGSRGCRFRPRALVARLIVLDLQLHLQAPLELVTDRKLCLLASDTSTRIYVFFGETLLLPV